jgi:protein-S-isoprenylcysteine O-methyltransferase Ste14
MMQAILLLLFALLILLIVAAKSDSLTRRSKIYLGVVVSVLLVAMYFYESSQTNRTEQDRQFVNAYKQGKTLTCGQYKVSKDNFIYVSGTQTFVPNDKQETLNGVIIEVSTCKESN